MLMNIFYIRTFLVLSVWILFGSQAHSQNGNWLDEGNYDISWYDKKKSKLYISTPEDLAGMAYLANSEFIFFKDQEIILKKNLDMSAHVWSPMSCLLGVLNGNGHVVDGLHIKPLGNQQSAVAFLSVLDGGTIKNLTIGKTSKIEANSLATSAAPFCAFASKDFVISNCKNYATVEAIQSSGIIDGCIEGTIKDCVNYGTLKGYCLSGIVNIIAHAIVENCQNYATFVMAQEESASINGIVNTVNAAVVKKCANYSDLSTSNLSLGTVSGIANNIHIRSTIVDCVNYGSIYSKWGTGIAFFCDESEILNCTNKGDIHSRDASGILRNTASQYHPQTLSKITDCVNFGKINCFSGCGIVVQLDAGIINRCVNKGDIYADDTTGEKFPTDVIPNAGAAANGIISSGRGYVLNCYNEGKISAFAKCVSAKDSLYVASRAYGIGGVNIFNSCNVGSVISKSIVDSKKQSHMFDIYAKAIGIGDYPRYCYNRGDVKCSFQYFVPSARSTESHSQIIYGAIHGRNPFTKEKSFGQNYFSTNLDRGYERCYHFIDNHYSETKSGMDGYVNDKESRTLEFIEKLNKRPDYVMIEDVKYELLPWKQDENGYPILDGLPYDCSTGIKDLKCDNSSINIILKGNCLHFEDGHSEMKRVTIFNLQGQIIDFFSTSNALVPLNCSNQFVVIKVQTNNQVITKKFFVK